MTDQAPPPLTPPPPAPASRAPVSALVIVGIIVSLVLVPLVVAGVYAIIRVSDHQDREGGSDSRRVSTADLRSGD